MYRNELSNYTTVYGGGNQLVTEFVKLVGYVEVHPNSASEILAKFDADVAKVRAAIAAQVAEPEEEG